MGDADKISPQADGEVVWSRRLDAGVKLVTMLCIVTCDGDKKARSPGSTKETVKTIRVRECRVIPADLW